MRPVIVFIHIPRTGGTSLTSLLQRHLPRYMRLSTKDDFAAFFALSQEERDSFDFLSGHMPFGVDAYLTRPAQYVVWLRDPVDRLISSYFHARTALGTTIYDYANSVSFLEYGLNAWPALRDNAQVHILASDFNHFSANPTGCLLRTPPSSITHDMLGAAKAGVSHAVVGLYEYFTESVIRTCRLADVPNADVPHMNAMPRTEEIDQSARSTIRSNVLALDCELYEHAADIFTRQDHAAILSNTGCNA
jgi:hypothetical protein